MSDDTRIQSTSTAVSPTGTPVVPARFVPVIVAVCGVAGAFAAFLPSHTIGFKAAAGIAAVCSILLGASPGLRK